MAVEKRRACGYRKTGGLYLCSGGVGAPCCKMPIILHVCPTCNGGIKQTRGWQWIDPRPWLKGECSMTRKTLQNHCPAAHPDMLGERVGLLWVGEQFYPTPEAFAKEANEMGVSRRITTIPRGFELGKTWVFMAHPKVQRVKVDRCELGADCKCEAATDNVVPICEHFREYDWVGGVFRIFKPDRIEKIVTETQAKDLDEMKKLIDAGITPVSVPDDDKDHQGTVYDKEDAPQKELEL